MNSMTQRNQKRKWKQGEVLFPLFLLFLPISLRMLDDHSWKNKLMKVSYYNYIQVRWDWSLCCPSPWNWLLSLATLKIISAQSFSLWLLTAENPLPRTYYYEVIWLLLGSRRGKERKRKRDRKVLTKSSIISPLKWFLLLERFTIDQL